MWRRAPVHGAVGAANHGCLAAIEVAYFLSGLSQALEVERCHWGEGGVALFIVMVLSWSDGAITLPSQAVA